MSEANSSTATATTSPFFRIPLEIREEIYFYALRQSTPIMIRHHREYRSEVPEAMRGRLLRLDKDSFEDQDALAKLSEIGDPPAANDTDSDTNDRDRTPTALLRVSKAIYDEALPALFRANRLVIDDPRHGQLWASGLALTPRVRGLVREVSVWMPQGEYGSELWQWCLLALHLWLPATAGVKLLVQAPCSHELGAMGWREANLQWIHLFLTARPRDDRSVQVGFFESLVEALRA